MSRGVTRAVYTQELFATNHDEANRAAVASVAAEELDLVGIAFRAERKTFDNYMDVKELLERLFGRRIDLVIAEAVKPQLRRGILEETIYAEGL